MSQHPALSRTASIKCRLLCGVGGNLEDAELVCKRVIAVVTKGGLGAEQHQARQVETYINSICPRLYATNYPGRARICALITRTCSAISVLESACPLT